MKALPTVILKFSNIIVLHFICQVLCDTKQIIYNKYDFECGTDKHFIYKPFIFFYVAFLHFYALNYITFFILFLLFLFHMCWKQYFHFLESNGTIINLMYFIKFFNTISSFLIFSFFLTSILYAGFTEISLVMIFSFKKIICFLEDWATSKWF